MKPTEEVPTEDTAAKPVIPAQTDGRSPTPPSIDSGGKTLWDLVYFLLSDWKGLPHLIGILAVISGVFLVVWWISLYAARSNQLEITQTEGGGIIYRVGREETLSFLLAASAPWDSPKEFIVKQGEWLRIRASGKVNLAIHHLVTAAENDTRPRHFWVGPDGMSEKNFNLLQKQDRWRSQYPLVPRKPYGSLIAGISNNKDVPPTSNDPIWYVGSDWEGPAPGGGILWFAVNDVLLTPNIPREAYEVPEAEREGDYILKGNWDDIGGGKYPNLWFDDNLGAFMVIVKKDK